jgi:predicted chitinase
MTNTQPIELEQLFRYWRALPHQQAAISELQEALKAPGATYATVMRRDLPWFRTWSTDGKQQDPQLVTMAQAVAVFERSPTTNQLADLNASLQRFGITNPARIRHFLAQVGHESGGLRWMLELASGEAYEGRKDLGNTQRGDGVRFKGAGAIQLTGRFNYQRFADFIKDQQVMQGAEYVATKYPFTSAGFWWHLNGMNQLVDNGASVRAVSARVNGRDPANGLNDRMAYYGRALQQFPDPAAPRPPLQQQTAPVTTGRVTPTSPFSARLTPNIRVGEFALDQEVRRFHHQHQVDTATELAQFLERVRKQFGGRAVIITSGYRPAAINRSVGGASGSEHLFDAPGVGAVDFQIQGADIRNVQAWCDREWAFSLGYGAPKGFVHLGIRRGRPRVRWNY